MNGLIQRLATSGLFSFDFTPENFITALFTNQTYMSAPVTWEHYAFAICVDNISNRAEEAWKMVKLKFNADTQKYEELANVSYTNAKGYYIQGGGASGKDISSGSTWNADGRVGSARAIAIWYK